MGEKTIITGNNAAAIGAMLARTQFIPAFPITPQTTIIEYLSKMCHGRNDVIFKPMESEHSVMAASIGASAAGLRVFTATSSQGLTLMHELLHWAVGGRYPIVMVNVNRSLGPPWNIHTEHTDSLSQRDTGWLQIYCSSNQEVLDTVIQAFAVAEIVSLPIMICLDGFLLSHTVEPVEIPPQELVDKFLKKRKPVFKLDTENPLNMGAHHTNFYYMELRKNIADNHFKALRVMEIVNRKFKKLFGRSYGVIEKHRTDDAEIAIITNATTVHVAEIAVNELREEGIKAGLINLRTVRPFPSTELGFALKRTKTAIIIERSFTSNQGGILAQEIKSAFYGLNHEIKSCIAGLGGRDITPEDIKNTVYLHKKDELLNIHWIGVRE